MIVAFSCSGLLYIRASYLVCCLQDMLRWHPLLQHGSLAWLGAADGEVPYANPNPSSTATPTSAAALLPLLRLLARARDPEVAAAAGQLAARRLGDMVGFEGNPVEGTLWLGLLPRGAAAGRNDQDGYGAPLWLLTCNPTVQ